MPLQGRFQAGERLALRSRHRQSADRPQEPAPLQIPRSLQCAGLGEGTRTPILYLAPWVDFGGTDKGTIDWFRWIDRGRFAPSLITTQPSLNRRLSEVEPYAEEVWPATEFFAGADLPGLIFDFIHTRGVEVLHVMNSRIAFDLLPDLAALPNPPAVVVQLHVEEHDKSGYVRYVTTRYGNLVDAFSVTSQHLADAVERYDVPRTKCRVIYTGVDAEDEFCPERVHPVEGLERGPVQLLYPGRLVEQKDPLLMVDVAGALRDRGLRFQVQVVGEGPLEAEVRGAVRERGLDDVVRFHPPTNEIARWYRACDVLLMTSVFEGVPYVVYEAMAMELPVVGPALPGNAELLDDRCGALISPRGHTQGYVKALAALIENGDARRDAGRHARERVRERFSLEQMGREHGELYDELTASRRASRRGRAAANCTDAGGPRVSGAAPALAPVRLRSRPSRGQPLVSVIVPCFNHGRYLPDCLNSLREQAYPSLEIIVVDDASSDPQTRLVIDELEQHADDVTVIRMPENSGPSAARNAAVERAQGRYLLPVDADNLLLPHAVERLVEQLQSAGERVGYVYPNLQFFGNRNDYFEAPVYNLHNLMQGNFADTSSLLDREIFDAGVRYPEDIVLGHEDWDFALSLAEREIYGEPAMAKTLLYRKVGFTRSDVVEYGPELFRDRIVPRHPGLYEKGRARKIKAAWAPGLSVIPLAPVSGVRQERLAQLASGQTFTDFELLSRASAPWQRDGEEPKLRRIPPELAASRTEALEIGWQNARGSVLLVTAGDGVELLQDRALLGKLMRILRLSPKATAIAMTDAGAAGRVQLRLLTPEDGIELNPHSIIWRRDDDEELSRRLRIRRGDEVGALTEAIALAMQTQWRHLPDSDEPQRADFGPSRGIRLRPRSRKRDIEERRRVLEAEPNFPQLEWGTIRRWIFAATWTPPETVLICRHVRADGRARVITNDRTPPLGFKLEYDLGLVHKFSTLGTARLIAHDGRYATVDAADPANDATTLGFVEQAPLPLLDALLFGVHVPSGDHVMVAGEDDPIREEVEPLGTLGFVESYPVNPRRRPEAEIPFRLKGLVRAVDRDARRHVYGVGELPSGQLVTELGALKEQPDADSVPVWLTADGALMTPDYVPTRPPPEAKRLARWVVAPLTWRGDVAPKRALARATARRFLDLASSSHRSETARREPAGAPVGYLSSTSRPGWIALFSAIHPVTGDQLLANSAIEAGDMGYVNATLLGHVVEVAPLTGRRGRNRVTVPWASRFGHYARTA